MPWHSDIIFAAYTREANITRQRRISLHSNTSRRKANITEKAIAKCNRFFMAGVAGFEPTNDGVKVRCVTASPHPSVGGAANLPIKRKNGVSEGTRTLGLQSHNLTR